MPSIADLPFVQKACRRLARHGWGSTLRQLFFRLLKATVQYGQKYGHLLLTGRLFTFRKYLCARLVWGAYVSF